MQDISIFQWAALALAAVAIALNLLALRLNAATERRINAALEGIEHSPSADEARQGIGERAGKNQHHLDGGSTQPASPASPVQVVRPVNQGDSALRSQANAVDEKRQAASGHPCIGEEARFDQLESGPAFGASSLQVIELRKALALRQLQDAHVQRQIDRLVFAGGHHGCPDNHNEHSKPRGRDPQGV